MPKTYLTTGNVNFAVVVTGPEVHSYGMSLSEILPEVRSLSAADKLRLIRLLSEDVDGAPDITPLEHGRAYAVATPQFESGATEALLRELQNTPPG